MRLAVLVLAGGCAAAPWKPNVWTDGPADPQAQPVAFEFPDGANGTALVIAVLAQAKSAEAAGISGFAIQVGRCTRAIAVTPPPDRREVRRDVDTERIALRASETKISCRRFVDQDLAPIERGSDGDKPKKFRDANMVVHEACDETPIDHVVLRYRFEVAAGPPTSPPTQRSVVDTRAAIIDLATRAATATKPEEATRLAEQAIAALDGIATPDDVLAKRIAAAYYYAVDADADGFLRRTAPQLRAVTDAWAGELGRDIDHIAKRYERIGDAVRLPVAAPWLRKGALRLADLHDHTASLLDAVEQPKAAEAERAKARSLRQ